MCMLEIGGSFGNNFTWKFGSLELNNFCKPFISLTLHKVSLSVVFSCRLDGGSPSFCTCYYGIGRESSSYKIIFFIY